MTFDPTRRRGEIYSAHLDIGDHYVLVVSWDSINEGLRQPICALITSKDQYRALPTYVAVDPLESGLSTTSYVLCHALFVLTEDQLDPAPKGRLPIRRMAEVDDALKIALGLEPPPPPDTEG